MKRLISVFLMLCLIVGLLPAIPLKAEAAVEPKATVSLWTDYAASSFAGGGGGENNPYLIATAEQLALVAVWANSGSGSAYSTTYFELIADIDLSAHLWVPIGTDEDTPFYGQFKGNGFTISGLKLTESSIHGNCAGLFGYADVSIVDLKLTDVSIDLYKCSVTYVGCASGKGGACTNVKVSGNISINTIGWVYCGGIIGDSEYVVHYTDNYFTRYGYVRNSSFDGSISISRAGDVAVGGLVGMDYLSSDGIQFWQCRSSGSITVSDVGSVRVGGLVGWCDRNCTNCYSTMNINAQGKNGTVGGLIGVSKGDVENCYATGSVSLTISTGGAGNGTSVSSAGGLVGTRHQGSISNCYTQNPSVTCTMTNATEQTYAGKLVGYSNATTGTVTNSYVSGNTTLKRNGFKDGGDCDADSYPVTTTADSTYSAPETDTFTYSQSFLSSTLYWSTTIWNMTGSSPTLCWEHYYKLRICYIDKKGAIFDIFYSHYKPGSSVTVSSPYKPSQTPDQAEVSVVVTKDTYIDVHYQHIHEPGKEATCASPQTCNLCGEILTEALPHDYTLTRVVEPNCTQYGYTLYTCQSCNGILKEDYILPLGHDLDPDNTCIRCAVSFKGPLEEHRIHVLDQETGNPIEGASVTLDQTTIKTDAEGIATHQLVAGEAVALSITADGYPKHSVSSFTPGELPDTYIYLTAKDTGIYEVRCNGKDVLLSVAQINAFAPTLTAQIVVKGRAKANITSYDLYQGDTVLATSTDGVFNVKNTRFRPKEPVYARMHTDSTSGNNLYIQKVNINVVGFSLDADTDWGKLLPFSAGMDLSFPGGTPVLEGLNFKIPSYANGKNGYVQVHVGNEKLMITFGDKTDFTNDGKDLDTKSKSQLLKKMRDNWVKQNNPNAWPEGDKENEVNASFAMVIEFSDSGVRSAYGQANVAYNLSFENGKTFLVWFIPVYAQISADFGGELQVSDIGYDFENAQVLIPDFQLSIHGQITLQEGFGCSVVSAGVYGTAGASLVFGVEDLREYMNYRIYGELGLYARLKLFFWKAMEYRLPLLRGEFSGSAGSYARRNMYSLQGYETVTRDYLKNRSPWLSYVPRSGNVSENVTMQTSSYTAIDPKLVVCGDTVMMVFADDDGSNGLNYQHLYYSLFQANTGVWTQPKRVDDNDLCDLEYEVCTDGEKIWIVYTQMDAVTEENQDAHEGLLSTVEVTAAVYDPDADTFIDHCALTDDDSFDSLPQIAMTPEGLRAAWVSNATNDAFSQNANNRLYSAVYVDGSWSKPTALTQSGATVVSMDLGLLNDKPYIATVRDVDCDLSTIEDRIVVLTDENGSSVTVPTEKNTNNFIQFVQLEGRQQLLWYSDSNLYTVTAPADAPTALFDRAVEGLNDGYRVISLNAQESAIIFTNHQRSADAESSSTLQLLYGCNGQWNSNSIPLTQPEADRYIEGYDVCVVNGKLLIPHISMSATVTETDIQRSADFRSSYAPIPQDLSVGEGVFLPSQLVEGKDLEVKLPVANHSLKPLEQINYRVTDQEGTLLLEGINPLLVAAGKTGWLSLSIPRSVINGNNGCHITLTAEGWTEDDLSNNSTKLALWYADLSVNANQLLLSGQQIHYAVANEGNTATEGTLDILLKEADGSETLLKSVDIPDLEAGKTFTGSMEVDQALCDSSRNIVLRVRAEQQELYDFNDETGLTLYPLVREETTSTVKQLMPDGPEVSTPHLVYDRYKGGNAQILIYENGWTGKGISTTSTITTYLCTAGSNNTPSKIELKQSDLKTWSIGYHQLLLKYWKDELYTELPVVIEVIDTTPVPASIYAEDQTVYMSDRPLALGRDVEYRVDSQGIVSASHAVDGTENWKTGLPTQIGIYRIRLNVAADTENGYSAGECVFTLEVLKGKRAISLPQVTALADGSYRFDRAVPTAGADDGIITYGFSTVNDPDTVEQWSEVGLIPAQEQTVTYYLFARVTDGKNYEDAYSLGEALNIHIHTYEATVTAPTCETPGFTTHICSVCQDRYTDAQTAPLGHSFTNYVSDNNATCTQNGTQTAVCDRCDVTDTQVLEDTATGHSFDEGRITSEPSCTQEGEMIFTCSCGEQYSTVLPANGHRYDTVVSPPSCEEPGFTSHTCSVCGDQYTDGQMPPTGHSFDEGVITQKATCTAEGSMTFCCNCGYQYTTVLPALGHDYVPAGTIPPTCELSGSTAIGCLNCGDVETTEIPPTGHSYTSTDTAPTCMEGGYTTNVCDACGKTEILEGAGALGHSFTSYVSDGNATCTEDGTKTAQCDRCAGTHTVIDSGSAFGHSFDGGTVTQSPGCITDGTITYRCDLCGDAYEDVIPATGHQYKTTVTAPSCEETGYSTHFCTVCGDTFVDSITPAAGHNYANGFCEVCGVLQPGYAIYSGSIQSYGDPTDPITVELFPQGSDAAAYTSVISNGANSFCFSGITASSYTLVISKKNHVTRYVYLDIEVGNNTMEHSLQIRLIGDITGEGKVNVGDVARLYGHIRKTSIITDEYILACAEVTGDGRINVGDTATLYSHVKNTKKLY